MREHHHHHVEEPLPDVVDFDYEVKWLNDLVADYCEQAQRSAYAARMIVLHLGEWRPGPDGQAKVSPELAAVYDLMESTSKQADRAADDACALYDGLIAAHGHGDTGEVIRQLGVLSMDVSAHLSTVVRLMDVPLPAAGGPEGTR